jgi:hypothetical protein
MEQKLKGIVFFVVYCNKPKERMMILWVWEERIVRKSVESVSNIYFLWTSLFLSLFSHFRYWFVASFEIFDKNGDGVLSKDEVRSMLIMVVKQVRLWFDALILLYIV